MSSSSLVLPIVALLVSLGMAGCTEDRVLIVQGQGALRCDGPRTLLLADGAGSGLDSLGETEDGWAVLYNEDRNLRLAEISPDIAISAGPVTLGGGKDYRSPVAVRERDGYRLVFSRRVDAEAQIWSGYLSDDEPTSLQEEMRAVAEGMVDSHRVVPRGVADQRILAWRSGRVAFVSDFEAGLAAEANALEETSDNRRILAFRAGSDAMWMLLEGDGYSVERFSVEGVPAGRVLEGGLGEHAALAVDGEEAWMVAAVGGQIEARPLHAEGSSQNLDARLPVVRLDADGSGGSVVIAWADAEGVSVSFDFAAPQRLDIPGVTQLRIRAFASGVLLAVHLEGGALGEQVNLHRICR
ncbi:MAG: hypothetical protein AAGF12_28435 [Myxococcota bacterium]